MELVEFLKFFKKNALAVIFFVFAGLVLSVLLSAKLPSGYSQSQTFYIVEPWKNAGAFYDYEGYYGQQKARDFTDTAVAILQSENFPNLTVRKVAPQVIKLTATAESADESENLLDRVKGSFNQELVSLSGQDQALQIRPICQVQPASFVSPNKKLLAVFGASLGFVFGVLVVGLKTYFKV